MFEQHVEISRLDGKFTVTNKPLLNPGHAEDEDDDDEQESRQTPASDQTTAFLPAASLFVWTSRFRGRRMLSSTVNIGRPKTPSMTPYDDTGWSFGELFSAKAVRITDPNDSRGADAARHGIASRWAAYRAKALSTPYANTGQAALGDVRIVCKSDAFMPSRKNHSDSGGHHYLSWNLPSAV